METTQFTLIGTHSKEETIGMFARHVSSGKAGFFKSAGIDFVPGQREGARDTVPRGHRKT